MQVPRGREDLSSIPLENPPISDDPGGAHTAITADGERQETVREDLGVRDAAGLAVGELLSLMNRAAAAVTTRTTDMREEAPPFPASQLKPPGVFTMQSCCV